jgi:SAM-dependent methyltransferase
MDPISQLYKEHYSQTFLLHGTTPKGVDWGPEPDVLVRYAKMLEVVSNDVPGKHSGPPRFLDVGCGYGGLYEFALKQGINLDYTGIDLSEDMIAHARAHLPNAIFICGDVFGFLPQNGIPFDYVVCNGILTLKLTASILEMDHFCQDLIRKMFALSRVGIAFNVMKTKVNYMSEKLYYRNPTELFAFCLTEVSERIRLDHAYRLFDYTIYLYH